MRVLLTNDDGITATGLNVLRRALLDVPGIELAVIAPDSNRSATARSITFSEPLEVEPQLIVSGINHGANMGDDITYSGTVAAAFEGIMLRLPAIAVSQQLGGEDDPRFEQAA